GQRVSEWHVCRTTDSVSRAIAVMNTFGTYLESPAEPLGRGINRDILDQPADAARAIQRPLGSAQHFHTSQLVRVQVRRRAAATEGGERHVIKGKSSRRRDISASGHAANRDGQLA